MSEEIKDYELSTHEEYSVVCDFCDDESTRDGNREIALRLAAIEGFTKVGSDIYCSSCLAAGQTT